MRKHLSKITKKIRHGIKVGHGHLVQRYSAKKVKYLSSGIKHMFEASIYDDLYQFFETEFDRDYSIKYLKPSQFRFG